MTYALVALVAILLLGVVEEMRDRHRLVARHTFAVEYANNFTALANRVMAGQRDDDLYQWLTLNVVKMQSDLGPLGEIAYKLPVSATVIPQYQLLLNTLPKLRTGLFHKNEVLWVHDALTRHIGVLQHRIEERRKGLFNPIVWLRCGVQIVITLPLSLAYWLGFMGLSRFDRLTNSPVVRLLSSTVTLLGLVITITLGWVPFVQMMHHMRL